MWNPIPVPQARWLSLALLITALSLAAALFTAAASSGARSTVLVNVRQTALGRVLVDARGRTLYLFEADHRGKSACYGQCAVYWPPLLAKGKPRAGKGLSARLLTTVSRRGGARQVVYNGHPLYLFVKDTRAGQTSGEGLNGFGAEWYALSPKGVKVEKPHSSSMTPPTTTSSGGGYGSYP